ncbi:uncharacterized protein BDZ83DRAFT_624617, partial [Colletotrichum acutatum]
MAPEVDVKGWISLSSGHLLRRHRVLNHCSLPEPPLSVHQHYLPPQEIDTQSIM